MKTFETFLEVTRKNLVIGVRSQQK